MNFKKLVPFFVAGALLGAAALGVATYQTVRAQAPTPTPATPAQTTPGAGTQIWQKGGRMMDDTAREQGLADALGITVDKLQAAYQTANQAALKQAVEKGLLTQAQADAMLARESAHPMGEFGRLKVSGIDYNALLADALGISADQLKAAQQKAFAASLDQAVTNGQLTQEQADLMKARNNLYNDSKFQSSLQSAYQAAVQQAVTDGIITQAQADQILKENSPSGFPGGPGGFFEGGRRGGHHGGGFGGFKGAPDSGNNPAAPANPNPASPTPSTGGDA